jgi:FkbM family methyltransferase
MLEYQSQNNETKIVLNYFGKKKGTVLEIGSNDGKTLSNSYDLIKMGWKSTLVEPSSVYKDMEILHKGNDMVETFNVAIGKEKGELTFYESGSHVNGGSDKALVSTADPEELKRWENVEFKKTKVLVISFKDLLEQSSNKIFDYISIDVEGMEMDILPQIDFKAIGCSCLCIEWNGEKDLRYKFKEYCRPFGLIEIHRNAENIIFAIR